MKNLIIVILVLGAMFLSSCEKIVGWVDSDGTISVPSSSDQTISSSDSTPAQSSRIALYWEDTSSGKSPQRKPWSDVITSNAKKDLSSFNSASDIELFCPKFKKLSDDNKIKAIGELFVSMSNFESGHNPKAQYRECSKSKCKYKSGCFEHKTYGYCMKGSSKYDEGTVISKGLLQLSISSSLSYGCDLKNADDLYNPEKNLACGFVIMKKQIARTGVIGGASNYWAVLKPTNDKQKLIKARVVKYAPKCL